MSDINIAVIILAGGIGKRFNKKISKQMFSYSGVTVLEMNIKNFQQYLKNIWKKKAIISNLKQIQR